MSERDVMPETDVPETDVPETDTQATDAAGRRVPRWLMWTVIGLVAAVVLFFAAIFLYAKVLNDSPDELDAGDLDAALAVSTTLGSDGAVGTGDAPVPTTADGTWVATSDSIVGYRVDEVLFGVNAAAAGRTSDVDGSLTVEGTQVTATDFTIDVATIESDDGRRDRQFRGRIMSVDEFPTATFTLTQPIELGTEPVEGTEITTSATGDLTLRGQTNPVTFDVTAELTNGKIGVLGQIPVVFAEYGIPNPSTAGISTEDNGLLEFVLVFEKG